MPDAPLRIGAIGLLGLFTVVDLRHPKGLQQAHGLLLVHRGYLDLRNTKLHDKLVHKLSREAVGGHLRNTSRWADSVVDAIPELILGDLELVTKDMAPKCWAVVRPIDGVRDAGS